VPVWSDDGLVLDHHPFRDRHLVVGILSPRLGAIRGVLRNARGGRAAGASATQILSLVRFTAFRGANAELATLREVELIRSSYPLADLGATAVAAVVAELLTTFCPPEEPAERRFRLGRAALEALLDGCDPHTVAAYVQLWLLALSGLLPPLETCSACQRDVSGQVAVHPRDGHALCEACRPADALRLDDGDLAFLRVCRHLPVAELPATVPGRVAQWLDLSVRAHAERPLRALDFLRRHSG
jgi:DNA repair protein RecO (recombination protein O)